MTELAEEIREFLMESHENLNALDQQMVELEKTPADERRMASIFRTIHTLKGTSEFFEFHVIGSIAHILESLLAQVRDKTRPLTPALVSLMLEALDAFKQLLAAIEKNDAEGEDRFQTLRERLSAAFQEGAKGTGLEPRPDSNAARSETPRRRGEERREGKDFRSAPPISHAEDARRVMDRFDGTRSTDRDAGSAIRVDVALLDRMLHLVDDLASVPDQRFAAPLQSNASHAPAEKVNRIARELRECVMLARMQPIGVIWNKFPRAVRDFATETGKVIEVRMEGALAELDRTIIEAIRDPLTHMIRNACDHGIESPQVRVANGKSPHGTIVLRAFNEGGYINIEVSDDGAGIDPEKIKHKALQKGLLQPEQATRMLDAEVQRLIFLPGLSTADTITSVSGRGVGMDVVKTNIERIHGTVTLASRTGMGTTVTMRIPPRPSSCSEWMCG
jgi:two-component system chemotaxis sensor kinase CheA